MAEVISKFDDNDDPGMVTPAKFDDSPAYDEAVDSLKVGETMVTPDGERVWPFLQELMTVLFGIDRTIKTMEGIFSTYIFLFPTVTV